MSYRLYMLVTQYYVIVVLLGVFIHLVCVVSDARVMGEHCVLYPCVPGC